MYAHRDELKEALSHALLGHPYDRNSRHRETFLIQHLSEQVADFDVGEISYEELRAAFYTEPLGNFDFDQWYAEKVDEGLYDAPN